MVPLALQWGSLKRMALVLEVCVDSVESAVAAADGGAQRVELCSDLAEGGVTPSAGLIAMVRKRVPIGVHVLIRPRAGDFYYSADEFEVMKRDIVLAKQLGANGVALGILSADANVDTARTTELVALARPMAVTFHRAFDAVGDPIVSLEELVKTGADRILTSGGAATALEGVAQLAQMVKVAAGRIVILGCGQIRETNVAEILKKTGLGEIHAALQSPVPSPVTPRNDRVLQGLGNDAGGLRFVVQRETVARLLAAAAKPDLESSPSH